MEKLKNIHPGEILRNEFLVPLSIGSDKFSKDIALSPARTVSVLKGEHRITADLALRLSKYFGNSTGFWLGLQHDFDIKNCANAIEHYPE